MLQQNCYMYRGLIIKTDRVYILYLLITDEVANLFKPFQLYMN